LTVLNLMETTDVTEDLWIMDSNISSITVSLTNLNIPTLPEMENVKPPKEDLSKSLNSPMFLKEMLML